MASNNNPIRPEVNVDNDEIDIKQKSLFTKIKEIIFCKE